MGSAAVSRVGVFSFYPVEKNVSECNHRKMLVKVEMISSTANMLIGLLIPT